MGLARGSFSRDCGRRRRGLAVVAVALTFFGRIPLCAAPPEGVASERKSVLILNVEQPHVPWVAGISSGIFSTLDAAPPEERPDVQTEYLDVLRHPETAPAQASWFRERYRGQGFDLIVAITGSALSFVTPLRDELWPGTPILLLTPQRAVATAALPPGVTGLGARFEVGRTLDLALTLFPKTRHVAYVSEDQADNAKWRRDLAPRGLDLAELAGLRLEELEKRIATLPPETVVFFESFHFDGSGRHFVPREVLARVAPLSNSPIFGVSATMTGYGLVGGWVLDYTEVGAETGRLALRLLRGESVAAAPDPSTFSRLVLDDRELRRFRVPASRIPPGAQVLYRRPSLWNDHPRTVIVAVVALVLEGLLIAALLIARRRRSEAMAMTDATLASLPNEVAVVDGAGKITRVNENWGAFGLHRRAMSDLPAPVGANYLDLFRKELRDGDPTAGQRLELVESVLKGRQRHGVVGFDLPTGGEIRRFEKHVQVLGKPARGAIIVNVDVTDRYQAEAEARRHQTEIAHLNRVASMGELASSLAHELNQPLAAILTNAQSARRLLAREAPDLQEVRESLHDIIEDDQRAGEVIQRMRSLLRKEQPARAPVDLNEIVRAVLLLVAGDASLRRTSVAPDLAPHLPPISGDSVQLKQIVLNLVVNGFDAVAEQQPAKRSIRVATAVADGKVELSVTDSGRGIRAGDLERVFEPFYTTKADGLGMGLPICRSIAEAHSGRLSVESRAGQGATFRLVLPVSQVAPV